MSLLLLSWPGTGALAVPGADIRRGRQCLASALSHGRKRSGENEDGGGLSPTHVAERGLAPPACPASLWRRLTFYSNHTLRL